MRLLPMKFKPHPTRTTAGHAAGLRSPLQAAEVTVSAPDSPMLRFALGKLEAALQQQGDTLKRTANQAPDQGAEIVVTVDPAALTDIGAEGFRRVKLAPGAEDHRRRRTRRDVWRAGRGGANPPGHALEQDQGPHGEGAARVSRHQVQPAVVGLSHQPRPRAAPGNLQGPQVLGGVPRHDGGEPVQRALALEPCIPTPT